MFLFDMDGTVTAAETLPLIAEHYGLLDEVGELTRLAVMGQMPYNESLEQRVALLGRLPVDEVSRLVAHVPLHRQVADFIARHDDHCAIVTSNLDCWCEGLMRRLGCKAHCSIGRVAGNRVTGVASIMRKEDVVDAYRSAGRRVVFVGDGHNDLEAMRHADVAIAVGLLPGTPAASLSAVVHHIFHDESALCRHLENLSTAPAMTNSPL